MTLAEFIERFDGRVEYPYQGFKLARGRVVWSDASWSDRAERGGRTAIVQRCVESEPRVEVRRHYAKPGTRIVFVRRDERP